MNHWDVTMIKAEDLPEGKTAKAKIKGLPVLLARVGQEIYALHNQCPHLGCMMHRGTLDGYLLTCPCHDWVFDIRCGEFTAAPEIKIPVYPVKVENGEILVKLEDTK
ncbi:Rieske (2Fe-2S) protein [Dethiobacter alkaliphilus]|uniref:Rieske (2Fe-2S) domain protein n=1 Tax=Dethiobacter alkaliphilus AHT 1 TaxID=555088 RepID=C0GJ48_DETAL|nr:Rieske (2Fe-2S) protein [Dethiobacter alkaliphilus]EEG76681.1 Rieske (2Fe-2S) domain protein [Dethiobacter alkaliphilus AHT 1]MCW3489186.1 Rieske (2Fe-2S) protein [Dethiobacter alkaliphilus]